MKHAAARLLRPGGGLSANRCYIQASKLPACHMLRRGASTTIHDPFTYFCDVDAEPLHRYRPGGYHTVLLGDFLHNGRYRVLHKLGWGGYSTVWAARDEREQRNVAVKIAVAEQKENSRESVILRSFTSIRSTHEGSDHVSSLIDCFRLRGPNGTHNCFVLDLVGPSAADVVEHRMRDDRLPGQLARHTARQALLGLDFLHEQGIVHGDLHTRNLAFAVPNLQGLSTDLLLERLKKPEIGKVTSKNGQPLEPGMPEYLVRPTSCPVDLKSTSPRVQIIDFGEAFMGHDPPRQLHTPLIVRAPEAIFGDALDHRVDLWSMGCMIFELVTGQPPFDSIMATPASVVSQMLPTTDDALPERWQAAWRKMSTAGHSLTGEEPEPEQELTLQEWLEEVYFDNDRRADFSHKEIATVGKLVRRLLRLEPAVRVSAKQLLQDPWLTNRG